MSNDRLHREMDERTVKAVLRRAAGDTTAPGALSMSRDELGAYVRCQQRGGFGYFSPNGSDFRRPSAAETTPPSAETLDNLDGIVGQRRPWTLNR